MVIGMELKIKGLDCGYQKNTIIKSIDLTIQQGEMWCVLGPNGVGKTTFFKTLLRLLEPIDGTILFNEKPIKTWKHKELARMIAYVPQSHVPPFAFTVEEVIAMGRNPHQWGTSKANITDQEAIDEAIELLDIRYLYHKNYMNISGGERQLTLLARAIAQQTPLLVLDEPVSNLDFGNQARLLKRICDLVTKKGKTIIMTTHYPDHSFLLDDTNVLLLQRDNMHEIGKGKDIVTEEAIQHLYHIDNRIVDLQDYQKRICIPL